MEILCYGLNHRTAPVEVRERFAVAESVAGDLGTRLARDAGGEALVLSTCNRVEIYVASESQGAAQRVLEGFVRERAGVEAEGSFYDAFVMRDGDLAIRHLFRVASGLDSMVLGETEIFGQIKKAYETAKGAGSTGRFLNRLFQKTFNVAKEVRTDTLITRGAVSVGAAAVELAEQIFGRLKDCTVMILGAGETAELTAGALQARGVRTMFVANRSYPRAEELAQKMAGKAVHFDRWTEEFEGVDILIGSTAAPHPVVTRAQLEPVMAERPGRPLFCIDLAVPRDIDPSVNALAGVYLYDIDSLQQIANRSIEERRRELSACEGIIDRHVMEFLEWKRADAVRVASVREGLERGGAVADGTAKPDRA